MAELHRGPEPRGIPDLGATTAPKPRVGVSFTAFIRHLDADGMTEAASVVRAPNGQQMAVLGRDQYLDVDELVALITANVAAMLIDAGVIRSSSSIADTARPGEPLIIAR